MRVVGVVDLRNGCAVHARAGDRSRYEPIERIADATIQPGDAVAVARAYRDRWGIDELYVADLDAIAGRTPQDRRVSELTALVPVWLDAGVASEDRARSALTLGIARVIVGLETLGSWDALREITSAVGGVRVAFSLDLRDGELMSCGDIAREPAHVAASRAVTAGVGSLIVIDVARVGTGVGLDLELIRRIRRESPVTELLAGGGIRNLDDMRGLADVGCDGVLIATALQRGALTAADVAVARTLFKPV